MKPDSQKIVTRFAPSPTGFLHVGGVRTALYTWAYAKKNKGTFILRIEDTDKEREVEGSMEHIIDSLKWLGIEWNEGPDIGGPHAPYIQSQRLDSYQKYAKILVEKGLAYADPYTKEELQAFREKAQADKRAFLYRNHRPENPPAWDGTQPLRFKHTDIGVSKWHDEVRGDLEAGPEALDDFILVKSDGYPTYNFAHIIDDLMMEVTHTFRADEYISSMPNYLALYKALDLELPAFVTLPPIMRPDGKKKLSKRDGAKDILDYKAEGYLPDAVMNFLAYIGWNPGDEREILSPEEFVQAFELSHIHKAGAKLNEEKLNWINKEYIKKLPSETIEKQIIQYIPEAGKDSVMLKKIVPIVVDRIIKLGDIKTMVDSGELSYYFTEPVYNAADLLCPEKLRKGSEATLKDISAFLKETSSKVTTIDEAAWNATSIKDALWDYATEKGRGLVLWAMRFALSGAEKSADPFTLADILGKKETLARLAEAASKIDA